MIENRPMGNAVGLLTKGLWSLDWQTGRADAFGGSGRCEWAAGRCADWQAGATRRVAKVR